MKNTLKNYLAGAFLLSSLTMISCVDEGEGSGPTTRSSETDGTTGDSRTNSDTGSDGGLGSDSDSSTDTSSDNDDTASSSSSSKYASFEKKAFDLVNDYRATKNLPALIYVEAISSVCRGHSENMANGSVSFSHDGFDSRGTALSSTVGWTTIGENIAYNYDSNPSQKAVTGWIGSPGHEANMTGNFTKAGMGVAKASDGRYYLTQIFIR